MKSNYVSALFLLLSTVTGAMCQDSADPFGSLDKAPQASQPKIPERSAGGVPLEGYSVPLLIMLIIDGRTSDIPDSFAARAYIWAFYNIITQYCPRDVNRLFQQKFADYTSQVDYPVKEGELDASLFYSREQCDSYDGKKMRESISAIIGSRADLAIDPYDDERTVALIQGRILSADKHGSPGGRPTVEMVGYSLREENIKSVSEWGQEVHQTLEIDCKDKDDDICVKIDALIQNDQKIIKCAYGSPGSGANYYFWYAKLPEEAGEMTVGRYRAFNAVFDSAVEKCPPYRNEARRFAVRKEEAKPVYLKKSPSDHP